MAKLELMDVNKKFGDKHVVADINLQVHDQDFVVLLGPSGCGKTTILRMIAGLEGLTSGTVLMDGKVINPIPPQDRDMAMVFQNYALYAHMNVFDNLAFGLKMHKVPKDQIQQRVNEVAKLLGIEHLLRRKPRALSGGEKQRVALGRAIVRNPRLFLMDEPLSNLDALLRIQMRTEILRLCWRISATVLYVTHDQTEAMTLGDKIVVLGATGRIQQVGAPLDIYYRPADRFVAQFVGAPPMNFIEEATLEEQEGKLVVRTLDFTLPLGKSQADALRARPNKALKSRKVVLGIRPEDIQCVLGQPEAQDLVAVVEVVEPLGRESIVVVNTGSQVLKGLADPSITFRIGETAALKVNNKNICLFDRETGLNVLSPSGESSVR